MPSLIFNDDGTVDVTVAVEGMSLDDYQWTYAYNDKGAVASQTIEGGPQSMTINYTDFQYDSYGNWISRKTSMMGQEMEQKRTITYYE